MSSSHREALAVSQQLADRFADEPWLTCLSVEFAGGGDCFVLIGVSPEYFEAVQRRYGSDSFAGVPVRFEPMEVGTALAGVAG